MAGPGPKDPSGPAGVRKVIDSSIWKMLLWGTEADSVGGLLRAEPSEGRGRAPPYPRSASSGHPPDERGTLWDRQGYDTMGAMERATYCLKCRRSAVHVEGVTRPGTPSVVARCSWCVTAERALAHTVREAKRRDEQRRQREVATAREQLAYGLQRRFDFGEVPNVRTVAASGTKGAKRWRSGGT